MSTALDRFVDALPHCAAARVRVLYVSGEFTSSCVECGKLGPSRREHVDAVAAWDLDRTQEQAHHANVGERS